MASQPLRMSMVMTADASGLSAAAGQSRREIADVGETARRTSGDMATLSAANDQAAAAALRAAEAARGQSAAEKDLRSAIAAATGIRGDRSAHDFRSRQADIAAYGAALDQLRARHVPVFAAEQSLAAAQDEVNRAFRVGAISAEEQAQALERVRLMHDRTALAAHMQREEYRQLAKVAREAQAADIAQTRFTGFMGVRPAAVGAARESASVFADAGMFDAMSAGAQRAARSTALASHEVQNLSFQMNDIAMMLATGQSPWIVMTQQGMQVSQIFGRRGLGEIIPALGAGIASLVNPTTLFLAGITAAGYAASYAFEALQGDVDDATLSVEEHRELIEAVADRWGDALPALKAYNDELERTRDLDEAIKASRALARQQYDELRGGFGAVTVDLSDLQEQLGGIADAGDMARLNREFGELQGNIADSTAKASDAKDVQDALLTIFNNTGIPAAKEYADEFGRIAENIGKASEKATKFLQEGATLKMLDGLPSLTRLDQFNRTPFQTQEDIMFERSRRQREQEENERLGRLVPVPTPAPNREEALPSARDVLRVQEEQLEQLRLEILLVGESEEVRARAIALMEAEQAIRSSGIDALGQEAQALRANAVAIADHSLAVERAADAWGTFQNAGERAIDGVLDRLSEGDLEGALEEIADGIQKTLLELAVGNPLKNMLFGTNHGTLDDLMSRLSKGGAKDPTSLVQSAVGSSVGAMNVTAGTVMINGALAGAGGVAERLFNPANANDPWGGLREVGTRAAGAGPSNPFLELIAAAEGTAGPNGYNTSLGYGRFTGGERNLTGMTLDEIDALQRQMLAHPDNAFNSSALGRYQITGRTMRGLRRDMGLRGDELYDEDMQDRMALRLAERRGPNVAGLRNEWEGLRNLPDSRIMDGWNAAQEAVSDFAAKAGDAVGNLGRLDLGIGDAATGLLDLGTGFGDLGKNLGGLLSGEGGGGLFSWLLKLLPFDGGGWTGAGGKHEPKGLVHGNEFVFSSEATSAIGVGNLEAMHEAAKAGRGFAEGGYFAGAAFSAPSRRAGAGVFDGAGSGTGDDSDRGARVVTLQPVIHNYAPVDVRQEEEDDGAGGKRPVLVIEERMAAGVNRRGSAFRGSIESTYGLRPKRRRF